MHLEKLYSVHRTMQHGNCTEQDRDPQWSDSQVHVVSQSDIYMHTDDSTENSQPLL